MTMTYVMRAKVSSMSLTFPIDATLKDGLPIQLVQADKRDMELLRRLYRVIIEQ